MAEFTAWKTLVWRGWDLLKAALGDTVEPAAMHVGFRLEEA